FNPPHPRPLSPQGRGEEEGGHSLDCSEALSAFLMRSRVSSRCALVVSSTVTPLSASNFSILASVAFRCSRARLRASAGARLLPSTRAVRSLRYDRCRFRRITDSSAFFGPLVPLTGLAQMLSVRPRNSSDISNGLTLASLSSFRALFWIRLSVSP